MCLKVTKTVMLIFQNIYNQNKINLLKKIIKKISSLHKKVNKNHPKIVSLKISIPLRKKNRNPLIECHINHLIHLIEFQNNHLNHLIEFHSNHHNHFCLKE